MAYSYDALNPIRTVDGAYVKTPSAYQYNLQDVSASDAGRTEDALMHKKRIAQKVKLEVSWNYIRTEDASAILQMFNPEYIEVTYLDVMAGAYLTKTFYVGDRKAPYYNATVGLWSNVAFDLIEQ